MPSPLTRWGGVLLACLTATAVAACGSGTSTSSTAAPSAATTTTTTRTTSATTPASTTTSSSSSSQTSTGASVATAAGPSRCTSADTRVAVHTMGAATGHAGLLLVFRNAGSATCTLSGYPGANLATAHGHQVPVPRTPQGFMGGLSPQAKVDPTARLAPGQEAAAVLEGNDFNPKGGGSCPQYTVLLVTPPNEHRPYTFTRAVSLCNPQIHPVVPGTSGRQGS